MWYRAASQLNEPRIEIVEYDENEEEVPYSGTNGGTISAYDSATDKFLGGITYAYYNGVPMMEDAKVYDMGRGVGGLLARKLMEHFEAHGHTRVDMHSTATPRARTMIQSLRNHGYDVNSNVPQENWRTKDEWNAQHQDSNFGVDSSRVDDDILLPPYSWHKPLFTIRTQGDNYPQDED